MSTLQPLCSACYQFTQGGQEYRVSIIISPIVITERDNVVRVAWACNRGRRCSNFACCYSRRELHLEGE
jgi:hypothetical protein